MEGLSQYSRIKWERSVRLKREGSLQEAEKELREALEEQPEHPLLLTSLAQLYLVQDRSKEAMILTDSVLSNNPQHPQALHVLGEIYYREKELQKALQCFKQAYEIAPGAYIARGIVKTLRDMKRYGEALEALDNALVQDRDNLALQKDRAVILNNRMGRREEALELYERISKLDPEDRFVRRQLYRLKGRERPAEKVVEELKKVVSLESRKDDAQLHEFLGQELKKLGKLREAAAEFQRARKLEPDNFYFMAQEGFCRYRLGEYSEAMGLLEPVFLRDPNDFRIKSTLKKMYESANNLEGFVLLLERALEKHPQNVKLIGALKGMKKKMEQKASSRRDHEGEADNR
ncbi:MAG: tetratricopeptide repeat protein [Deltaproteobacteria bacterium]|nr:tetratricopeptide repeat protein [Deltaproteobacteria bacterium]